MNILAIDPATHCGWAARLDSRIVSGVWDLSIRRDESGGMRLVRFRAKLQEMIHHIDLVVFEAARHAAPKMQGALVCQAELQGVLKAFCEEHDIQYRGYSPSEIKKFITGNGTANKQTVIKAVQELLGLNVQDDNEADAVALLLLAEEELRAKI